MGHMSLFASVAVLATEPFDSLRDVPPGAVVGVVALFLVVTVISFLRKLILLGFLVAVVTGLFLAYRAGAFDQTLSGVLDRVPSRS